MSTNQKNCKCERNNIIPHEEFVSSHIRRATNRLEIRSTCLKAFKLLQRASEHLLKYFECWILLLGEVLFFQLMKGKKRSVLGNTSVACYHFVFSVCLFVCFLFFCCCCCCCCCCCYARDANGTTRAQILYVIPYGICAIHTYIHIKFYWHSPMGLFSDNWVQKLQIIKIHYHIISTHSF